MFDNAADPKATQKTLVGNRASANMLSVLSGEEVAVSLGCGSGAVAIGQR